MYPQNQPQSSGLGKKLGLIAIIVGGLVVLSCVGCFGYFAYIGDRGGARAPHEMENYATEYTQENAVLRPDEKLIVYYDVTMATDSTNAYYVTDQRLLHHAPGGDLSIPVGQVTEVSSRDSGLGTWTYVVVGANGDALTFEIPAFNGIEKFGRGIDRALKGAGNPVEFEIPPRE